MNTSQSSYFLRPLTALLFVLLFAQYADYRFGFGFGYRFFWYDMLLHFLGGFWVAGMIIWYRFLEHQEQAPAVRTVLFFTLGGAFLIGFGWEIFEITVRVLVGADLEPYRDGASDMVLDLLGASAMSFLYLRRFASEKASRIY